MKFQSWVKKMDEKFEPVYKWLYHKMAGQGGAVLRQIIALIGCVYLVARIRKSTYSVSHTDTEYIDLMILALVILFIMKFVLPRMAEVYEWLKHRVSPTIASVCSGMIGYLMVVGASKTIMPVAFEVYFATAFGVQF